MKKWVTQIIKGMEQILQEERPKAFQTFFFRKETQSSSEDIREIYKNTQCGKISQFSGRTYDLHTKL